MFWLPLATTLASTALGKQKYDRQKQIENDTRTQRAAEQKYSWATGRDPSTQIQHAGSMWGEMAGGALSGLQTGASLGGMFSGGGGVNNVGAGGGSALGVDSSKLGDPSLMSPAGGGGGMFSSGVGAVPGATPTLTAPKLGSSAGFGAGSLYADELNRPAHLQNYKNTAGYQF